MMQECGDGKDNHVACYCPAGTRILHPQHFQILLLSSLITVSLATDNRFSSHIISSLIIASLKISSLIISSLFSCTQGSGALKAVLDNYHSTPVSEECNKLESGIAASENGFACVGGVRLEAISWTNEGYDVGSKATTVSGNVNNAQLGTFTLCKLVKYQVQLQYRARALFNLLLSLLHLLVHPSHFSLFSFLHSFSFSIQVSPKPLFSIGEGTGTLPTIESINVSANAHELIQCDTGEGMEADVNVSITVDGIDSSGTSKSYYSFSCFIRV